MVVLPAATPVTTPVPETVATEVDELLHTPPAVASARAVVEPAQTVFVPVIAAGAAGMSLIVSDFVTEAEHPEVTV